MTADTSDKSGVPGTWGVEFGGSAVRLVHVSREGERWRVDRLIEAGLPDRWDATVSPAQGAGLLGHVPLREAVAVSLGDEHVLYRGLSLPGGAEAAVKAMIDRQVEALVPGDRAGFAVGTISGNPQNHERVHVVIAAARREMVAAAVEGAWALGRAPQAVVPAMLATAKAWMAFYESERRPVVLLDVGARCTGMAVLVSPLVGRYDVVDMGGDAFTEALARATGLTSRQAEARKIEPGAEELAEPLRPALARWARAVREAYDHCTEGLAESEKPVRCVLLGRGSRLAGLAGRVEQALGMPASAAGAPERLAAPEGVDARVCLTAAMTAIAAIEPPGRLLSLAGPPQRRRWGVRIGGRWAALAGWALAALLGWWGFDMLAAARTDRALRQTQGQMADRGGLERQLATGRYLESLGPTALEAMDAVSQGLGGKAILANLQFRGHGEVSMAGTVANDQELTAVLKSLAGVGQVELRNARPDKDRLRFELTVKLGPARQTPTTGPASGPGGGATQPASTQPGRRPRTMRGGRP